MEIPVTIDMIQQTKGNFETPEIRVWCHPHKIGKSGDDYYYTFPSFEDALTFIDTHDEAENHPLIAFRGYEINLFAIEEKREDKS